MTKIRGLEIRKIIKDSKELSQTKLAKICTVSKTLVSYWLSEKRPIPDDKYDLIINYIHSVNNMFKNDDVIHTVNLDSKYETIQKDLLDKLEIHNKYGAYYNDLVDHAVYLFKLKDELQGDIQENGLRVSMTTGNGHEKEVDNASIRNLNQVSSQLLRVLKDLGLDTPTSDKDEFDESDYT